jgi:hypothetical protein
MWDISSVLDNGCIEAVILSMVLDLWDNLYTASIDWMVLNNGLECMWKEEVVA